MEKSAEGGWDRRDVTVRLSKRRKAELLKLARSLAPGATPTQAIDHALALALSRSEAGESSAVLELVEQLSEEQARSIAACASEVARLHREMAELTAVIRAVADLEG